MNPTRITVVIPSYNHGKYLQDAVESVENSGFQNYEIIIVDDGSTDSSSTKVAQEFKNKGYNVILQNNQGVAASRNNAIRIAKGEFIIPLDADNRLLKPYFFEGLKILEQNPEIGVVYGDAQVIGEKSGTWVNHQMQLEEIIFENYIDNCTIIRKSAWESIGGYDEKAPFHTREDWYFWLGLIGKGWKFHHLNEFCFEYRFLADSKVRSRFADPKNRLVIYTYIYPLQEKLAWQYKNTPELSESQANFIVGKLRMQLAYYHLGNGSIVKGYFWLFQSLVGSNGLIAFFKTGLGWPFRRFRAAFK
jgi:glycosyltransferase involved in cell wall biosynthesis